MIGVLGCNYIAVCGPGNTIHLVKSLLIFTTIKPAKTRKITGSDRKDKKRTIEYRYNFII